MAERSGRDQRPNRRAMPVTGMRSQSIGWPSAGRAGALHCRRPVHLNTELRQDDLHHVKGALRRAA